jgi:presenilin-like A22 family membrane protease
MNQRSRAFVAGGAIVALFLVVQLGALAVVEPFKAAGYQTVEDPSDPTNSLLYVFAILVATAVMLAAFRFGGERVIRLVIVASGAYISLFVFRLIVPPVVSVPLDGVSVNVVAVGAALALGVALYVHPEWYVIDLTGILMGIGAAGLFGISFGILPALLLLVVLAVYDAISVYGTEHMLTLASGVMDLKVPVVLVIPLTLSYSFLDAEPPEAVRDEEAAGPEDGQAAAAANGGDGEERPAQEAADAEGEEVEEADGDLPEGEEAEGEVLERDALFIGLGDAVIPSVLVASAGFFAPASMPSIDVVGLAVSWPAAGAVVGTTAGLLVLLRMVLQGRAHAGLPLLNGGAIAGYLVGALAGGLTLLEALGLSGLL